MSHLPVVFLSLCHLLRFLIDASQSAECSRLPVYVSFVHHCTQILQRDATAYINISLQSALHLMQSCKEPKVLHKLTSVCHSMALSS